MAVCDLVIVGSYPPMPGKATAATLAAVRRGWDEGLAVRVVSYRTGAADIAVPVAGPLAGWRLENVRRHYGGARRLVLVVQAGAPFCDLRPARQLATAAGLVVAMKRFERATLVIGEDPRIMPSCLRSLMGAAEACIVSSEESARLIAERYHFSRGSLCVEEAEEYPALPAGVEPESAGLYRPSMARGLTVVPLPATTIAQRARARAPVAKSALLRRLTGR